MPSKFNFSAKAAAWNGLKKEALQEIAEDAKLTFDKAFENEGLEGAKTWDEVKRRMPGTAAYRAAKGNQNTDPILTGVTRVLRNSNMIESVTSFQAVLINPTPYGVYHNEGTEHVVARPFMKQTPVMTLRQLRILKRVTSKVWKIK